MGSVKFKDLKAYVRYDGNGRVVAGSLVFRKKKPKNGRWVEISSNLCCNPNPIPNPSTTTTTTTNGGGGTVGYPYFAYTGSVPSYACAGNGPTTLYMLTPTLTQFQNVYVDPACTIPYAYGGGLFFPGDQGMFTNHVFITTGTGQLLNQGLCSEFTKTVYTGYDATSACNHVYGSQTAYTRSIWSVGTTVYSDAACNTPWTNQWFALDDGSIYVTDAYGSLGFVGNCASITTTTTTTIPVYYYMTNQYNCPDCGTIAASNVVIKGFNPVPDGQFVFRNPGTGFISFQILYQTTPDPGAMLVDTGGYSPTCFCP